jgi:outer membrane protein assembly factor BamB
VAETPTVTRATRRRLLGLAGAGLAGLTGCAETLSDPNDGGDGEDGDDDPTVDPASLGEYRQFQFDAGNTGSGGGDLRAPGRAWTFREAPRNPGYGVGSPAVADGRVFVAEGSIVDDRASTVGYALDAGDGSVAWRRTLAEGANVTGEAAVAGDRVLFRVNDLVAHDRASGERLWRYADEDRGTAGEVALDPEAGVAYLALLGVAENELVALDLSSGEVRWSRTVGGGREPPRIGVDPAGGAVWVGGGRSLRAYDLAGDPLVEVPLDHAAVTAPTVGADRVYVAGDDRSVSAVDPDAGVAWTTRVEGSPDVQGFGPVGESPVLLDGRLYVSYMGRVTALGASDGVPVWTADVRSSNPLVAGTETVYASDLSSVTALAAESGRRLWTERTDATTGGRVTPAAVEGALFLPSGGLVALAE